MVSKKQLDAVMHVLCDFYETHPESSYVTISGLHRGGIKDPDNIVNILEAKGLVVVGSKYKEVIRSECPIRLTPQGKTYFIDKQSKKTITRNQFIRDSFIALLGAVVGSLVTWFIGHKSDGSETSSL